MTSAEDLVREHEALLFRRAYPRNHAELVHSERGLSRFGDRVRRFAAAGGDLEPFDRPEVSGIAGTSITTDYSFDVVRWLARQAPRRLRFAWADHDEIDRLRALLPKFVPLLAEEALEDANVPYLDWLRAVVPDARREVDWLLSRIESLPLDPADRAERYDALQLPLAWELGDGNMTRTHMRWRSGRPFYHPGALIARRDVSLPEMLATPPLPVRKLPVAEGLRIVDLTRAATVLRYREYYGFTYADPASVRAARIGRGVEIFLMGLERERRLPLRAGFAGFVVKNRVPVGYIEGLALFERIEIGFNIYYTFREGESAWIFGRVLRLLNQVYGVTSFSIDPYQLGHENPEAIESGAFWFYRKLGFRPTSPGVRRLVDSEERRIASRPGYRSSARTLARLVTGNVLYEIDPARAGDWDRFHVRNLGLAVQRRIARTHRGNERKARTAAAKRIEGVLGASVPADLALVLDLIDDLARWSPAEKRALVGVVRAKSGREEVGYLKRLQRHERLRAALIRLGS